MYAVEEKNKIIDGFKLKSKCIFSFEELYQEMVKWFRHYNYEWKELEYKKIDNPDGSQTAEVRWECLKKVDDYVSVLANIFVRAIMSSVEVTIGNEKKMMNKGDVEVKFDTAMMKNVSVWENKPMGKVAGLIYDKVLIKERLRYYEDEIRNESVKLINEVKEYLSIYAK